MPTSVFDERHSADSYCSYFLSSSLWLWSWLWLVVVAAVVVVVVVVIVVVAAAAAVVGFVIFVGVVFDDMYHNEEKTMVTVRVKKGSRR